MAASEVHASGLPDIDLPVAAMVDQDTLDQANTFEGEYVFAGGQKQRDGIDAAIETSMAAVSPLVRNFGRKRLKETNPVPNKLSIKVNGDQVKISFDGDGHAAKLDGAPVKSKSRRGDNIKVSYRMRGARLSHLIDGVGGDRLNKFKLSDDGKRVTVKVQISSSQLPVPVEYRLTFKRS